MPQTAGTVILTCQGVEGWRKGVIRLAMSREVAIMAWRARKTGRERWQGGLNAKDGRNGYTYLPRG